MSYLDCAQYDCCHNKAGCCCLDSINVRHTGPATAGAAATSLPTTSRPRPRPRSTATTGAAAILRGAAAAPTTSALTSAAAAPNAPPAPRGRPPNNFIPERMPFSQSGIPFLLLNHPLCCIIRRYSRSCPPFCGKTWCTCGSSGTPTPTTPQIFERCAAPRSTTFIIYYFLFII